MQDILERAARVRLVIFDVDGVLTDGSLYLGDDGQEYKAFHSRDGHGMKMLQAAGVEIGIITGRSSEVVRLRMASLGIEQVYQGQLDKRVAYERMKADLGLTDSEVAYVGDDVNDLPVFAQVGLSAAPADAPLEVRSEAVMSLSANGGRGCVREFVEAILRARGQWDEALATIGVVLP